MRAKNMLALQRVLYVVRRLAKFMMICQQEQQKIGNLQKPQFDIKPPSTFKSNTSLIKNIKEFPELQISEYQYKDEIQQAKQFYHIISIILASM